jgi:hypothetical protein
MRALVFTLLSEGSSDRTLIPILLWTLRQHSESMFQPQWADLRRLPNPPRSLEQRLQAALELYPCDLLFVHRDGNRSGLSKRREEIEAALAGTSEQPAVAVVPVRTQEAWLLFDEGAIRTAAGNPNGDDPLGLPTLHRLEEEPDPKHRLHEILRAASGLGPRRRRSLRPGPAVHRIAQLIADFSPLRTLAAFSAFEQDLAILLDDRGWRGEGVS